MHMNNKAMKLLLLTVSLLLLAPTLLAESPHSDFSTAPVRNMGPMPADRDPIPHTAATLRRYDSGLSMTIVTAVPVDAVTQKSAYTVWWVVFNHPENCTNPVSDSSGVISACSAADLTNPAVQAAGLWATGILVEATFVENGVSKGVLNVSGQLGVGADGVPLPGSSLTPGILSNVKGAEVHLVVRNHGALDGTNDFLEFTSGEMGGDPNLPGQARNIQFAVFQP